MKSSYSFQFINEEIDYYNTTPRICIFFFLALLETLYCLQRLYVTKYLTHSTLVSFTAYLAHFTPRFLLIKFDKRRFLYVFFFFYANLMKTCLNPSCSEITEFPIFVFCKRTTGPTTGIVSIQTGNKNSPRREYCKTRLVTVFIIRSISADLRLWFDYPVSHPLPLITCHTKSLKRDIDSS